jgi:ribonuclease E
MPHRETAGVTAEPAEIRAPVEEPSRRAFEAEPVAQAPVAPSAEAPERAPAAVEHPAPEPASAAPYEPIQTATPEPVAAFAAPAAPPRPAPTVLEAPAPAPDLEEVLKESGLVMIETQASKAQAVVASVEEESATPRRPRERRPPPADLNVPLQQVETRKEEDQPSA